MRSEKKRRLSSYLGVLAVIVGTPYAVYYLNLFFSEKANQRTSDEPGGSEFIEFTDRFASFCSKQRYQEGFIKEQGKFYPEGPEFTLMWVIVPSVTKEGIEAVLLLPGAPRTLSRRKGSKFVLFDNNLLWIDENLIRMMRDRKGVLDVRGGRTMLVYDTELGSINVIRRRLISLGELREVRPNGIGHAPL